MLAAYQIEAVFNVKHTELITNSTKFMDINQLTKQTEKHALGTHITTHYTILHSIDTF